MLLWIKWHLGPYGQKPVVWKVRQNSVLYFGCLVRVLSSAMPCANWHFSPYLQVPFSSKGLHNSVLYRDEFWAALDAVWLLLALAVALAWLGLACCCCCCDWMVAAGAPFCWRMLELLEVVTEVGFKVVMLRWLLLLFWLWDCWLWLGCC